jgi:outer membrane receptor for ferrienterochelin and colicins
LKHTELQIGYEYTFESGSSYKLVDQQQKVNDLGIYASALYRYKKLSVQPSCRVTFSNRYNTYSTPAVHAKIDLNERTQLRASYARGFRAPTLKEMYLQFVDQNHTILGNEDLKPESGNHIQLGLDHQQTIKKWNLSYSVNAYQNAVHNLIALAIYNNHGVLRRYDNIENYRNWILNTKGSVSRANLTLQAGAGIIYVEKSNITPEHIITEFSYTSSYLFKRYQTTLNLNYKYNSRQPVITVNQEFLYTSPLHAANVSVQRPFFKKRLLAQAGIKNLFNIQTSTLSGNINAQTGGHTSSGALQVFPARSFFTDLTYSF